jgi:DNA gyrase inhibitor GyrI
MKKLDEKPRKFIYHKAGMGMRASIGFSPEHVKIYGIYDGTDEDKTVNVIRYDKCIVIAPRDSIPTKKELEQIEADIKGARESLTEACENLIGELQYMLSLINKETT